MQNKVYLDENGTIIIESIGLQTYQAAKDTEIELIKVVKVLRAQQKPVLLYVDLSKLTGHTIGGRKGSFELLSVLDFDKIAITGINTMLKYIVILMVKASGKGDKIFITGNKEQATAWLKIKSHEK